MFYVVIAFVALSIAVLAVTTEQSQDVLDHHRKSALDIHRYFMHSGLSNVDPCVVEEVGDFVSDTALPNCYKDVENGE